MATHFSILAWRIPWTEEPNRLQSVGSQRVRQDLSAICDPMYSSPWNFPGQNTGVSSLSLLQGIFPIQGLKPGLLHCRWILYQLSYPGSLQHVNVEGTQEFGLLYPFTSASCRWGSTHLKEQPQADGRALCDQDSCSRPGGLQGINVSWN